MPVSIRNISLSCTLIILIIAALTAASEIQIIQKSPDPFGSPRPSPGQINVPTRTSFYIMLGFDEKNDDDSVLPESVAVQIRPTDGNAIEILSPGKKFHHGYSGKVEAKIWPQRSVILNIDSTVELKPLTKYFITVSARSKKGDTLSQKAGQWQFTTEAKTVAAPISFDIDLSNPGTQWHGGFYTGVCKPSFCTGNLLIETYDLMDKVRKQYPKAFSIERDFWCTGMEQKAPHGLSSIGLPNVVRERETRCIMTIQKHHDGILLRVEDFFGHEQYGIDSNRPLAPDYHPGDEVLIADGISNAKVKVVKVLEDSGPVKTLVVTEFNEPAGGWKIAYSVPLPTKEDPNNPGLFGPGGCYLRKFAPAGTPHYYWGRLDKEFDIHRRYNKRLQVNFADAPGDLSVDGQNWTYPKDYAEYHNAIKAFVSHLIDRYGDACKSFTWSVFNEPDLSSSFWRSHDWNQLQTCYDYAVDAVCRAFEDKGYDSNSVFVGGLELGAIWGTNLKDPILRNFLIHCSPKAVGEGALPKNAAYADKRLDGKRSQRVEKLCKKTGGKGSPCDFVSVHTYNSSPVAAEKLIMAKKIALEVDADYYADLWINSGESCPNWTPPPDKAAFESYMGNGYFTAWTADMVYRQLAQAAADKRYGFGETYMTIWPSPNGNFDTGLNNLSRVIAVDDNNDGKTDRNVTIAEPILNFMALMSSMGNDYLVLPEQKIGNNTISGFASKKPQAVSMLLYSHNPSDIQSRSNFAVEAAVDIKNLPWDQVSVKEYRFDKDNNSYYRLGVELRNRPRKSAMRTPDPNDAQRILAGLNSGDPNVQAATIEKLHGLGDLPEEVIGKILELYHSSKNPKVLSAFKSATRKMRDSQVCYSAKDVAGVVEMSQLHVTKESRHKLSDGKLRLPVTMTANGADFVLIEPAAKH